ncbi:MAG: ACT domain-containing protein, partial [Deltaproteobacteria bacterium]|nr:ACT domain-containing protein [Deltaproteobacteria bacterium]
SMEDLSIKSITTHSHAVLINVMLEAGDPGTETIAALFGKYELKTILYQKLMLDTTARISCIVDSRDGDRIDRFLEHISGKSIPHEVKREVATVSVIGTGVACNPEVITQMEQSLKTAGIPVMLAGNSSLSVTCLIPADSCQKAVQILHESFFTKSKSD